MENRENRKLQFILLTLLILVAAYIRIHGTSIYYYHADELMHVKIAEGTTLKQVMQFSFYETHPPLGHIIRHYWQKISDTIWFARCLSLVFGLALIPLYYQIGKKLNGELTGICAAILITFSRGCIIQSYVVRNYTIFLFFLSVCFYVYLLWRDDRKNNGLLALYGLFALLACLTHFAAILTLVPITIFEIICIWRDKNISLDSHIKWVALHAILAVLAVITFFLWNSSITPVHSIASGAMASLKPYEMLFLAGFYPFHLLGYILPEQNFIFLLILFAPLTIVKMHKNLGQFFALAIGVLFFAIILFVTKIYPFAGNRHGIWLLPFLIPLAASIMANAVEYLWGRLKCFPRYQYALSIYLIFFVTLVFYNPAERFSDSTEYRLKESQWKEIQAYLNHLGKSDLLISGRTDAIMLSPSQENIYTYLGDNPFSITSSAAIIPYYNTHLLFNNRYTMRIYENASLVKILEEANAKGQLDNYENFVFVNTYMASDPMLRLIKCDSLNKKIVSFSETTSDIAGYNAIFLIVKKQDFFMQIISPAGQARQCLFSNL
jgi:4-amino-4-deoxy-L-arabinose transferase-like glycosyltransferase